MADPHAIALRPKSDAAPPALELPRATFRMMAMRVTASANAQLDELLDLVVVALQLTRTQHQSAEEKYKAVGTWLSEEGSAIRHLSPRIYSQGSLRAGTTVKPLRHQEFDLDLVCELEASSSVLPSEAYELLWSRMHSNLRYRPILERMPRCIRLNYANDFHLDIVPAVPDPDGASATSILIPDRAKQAWLPSDPKGYAQWFEDQTVPVRRKHALDSSVEPLQLPQAAHEKASLKLAVQLLKRWRDIAFAKRAEVPPSSIVLTTLAGLAYRREEHVTDALAGILTRTLADARSTVIRLFNCESKGRDHGSLARSSRSVSGVRGRARAIYG
jgi:hypothetical protein